EGDGGEEGGRVHEGRDALGDRVPDLEIPGHALDEGPGAAPLRVGAAGRRMDAGRYVQRLEPLPEDVVRRVVREATLEEDRADEGRLEAARPKRASPVPVQDRRLEALGVDLVPEGAARDHAVVALEVLLPDLGRLVDVAVDVDDGHQ